MRDSACQRSCGFCPSWLVLFRVVRAAPPGGPRIFFLPVLLCFAYLLLFSRGSVSAQDQEVLLRQRAVAERIYRSRTSTLAARRVSELLETGDDTEVLRVAQKILDQDDDSFTDDANSVRLAVETAIRNAAPEVRRKYDALVSATAQRFLAEALEDQQPEKLRQVCRRYFLTSAGYTAAENLAAHWVDAGEFGLAKRLADQIIADPWHRQRITPAFRRLAARLDSILGIGGMNNGVPPVTEAADFVRRFDRQRDRLVPLQSGWMLLGGNPERTRLVAGSPPVPVATWQVDYLPASSTRWTRELIRDWEGVRRELDQPDCPASYPIIVDGQIIFRDIAGVRSIDAARGTTNWMYRCRYNLLQPVGRETGPVRRFLPGNFAVVSSSGIAGANALGENSLVSSLSSDGQRVYVVDAMTALEDAGPYDPTNEESAAQRFQNRLIALSVKPDRIDSRVAWIQSGQLPDRLIKLGGATELRFLGPPLPGSSELLCLTEQDLEVHLTALEPQTGAILWTLPLCTLERAEQFDQDRHETASLLARSDGIVVCPTNTGLLVAVDQARASLLWASYVDELPSANQQFRSSFRPPTIGYAGFVPHVAISQGRVYCLSQHSRQFHCLDLATGRILWSIPRDDSEFVGAISDRQVLLVGRQRCRSLSADQGKEIWSATITPPVGRGIAIGNRYVLPLEDGRLAAFDLVTGRDVGTRALSSDTPLGHLVADQNRVYSLSPQGIAAFPEVDHVLSTIEAGLPDERLSASRRIMQAEVAIVQGDLRDADARLRAVLSEELTAPDRERARRDLKELLFERLASGPELKTDDYELLENLLVSPQEQFRLVVSASSGNQKSPAISLVQRLVKRAYELPPQVTAPVSEKGDWTISPSAWCRLRMRDSADDPFGHQVRTLRAARRPRLSDEENLDDIQRYVTVFHSDPKMEPIREYLSEQLESAGALHAAENLLLRNRQDERPAVAAAATIELVNLWEKCGLVTDAVRLLEQLSTEYADVKLPEGLTVAHFLRRLSPDRPAVRAWNLSRAPAWPVSRVEIQQSNVAPNFREVMLPQVAGAEDSPAFEWDRQNLIGRQGRRSGPYGQSVEFVVSASGVEDQAVLSVVDQRTQTRLGAVKIPAVHRISSGDKISAGGHLLPMGVLGGMIGVSTLQLGDDEPVWTQFPRGLTGRRTPVFPGASGADFASFIWKNRLFVIDPLDGGLLWERRIPAETDSPYSLEIVGDRHVLAIYRDDRTIDPPRRVYEVFETATGRNVRTVRPGYVPGVWQGAFGRFVAGFADTPEGRRLQIRDLLNDTVEMSEPVADPNRQPMLLPGGHLLFLGMKGEIKMFDVARCRKEMSTMLPESELVPIGGYRSFVDQERCFVNLQRHTPTATTTHTNQAITNSSIPSVHVRDDLYAFDLVSGELLWKRSLPYRTILQMPECHIPFLVSVSQVIDRVKNSVQSLTIEVIDSATGVTIGYRENLTFDQLLTAQYDGQAGRILIRGSSSNIEIRFGPAESGTEAARREP